nr:MAG TPA: Endo-N-acetylneuraminidase [Caudoviricetes sp.]
MATWARGVNFKNSSNTKNIGGIGVYGSDTSAQKLYIGLGSEPWNNVGLQLTSSAINFKGNKIYHAGDKPTASEIGAAAASHTHNYAAASHNHTVLTGINDTRTTEYTPATARNEFKVTFQKNGTNGVNDGGSWYTLMHIPRYPDASGGFGSQMALTDNENIWYRKGTSDTAWTGWKKIWHSGNFDPNSKANSSHAHNYAGSSSAGGAATTALACTGNSATATTSNYLASNARMDYGWNGLNYFNLSGTAGNAAKANDTPTTAWWHIMRLNHANSTGYYTDLAIPFNDTSIYYKRITSGAVQNGGWVRVLDSLNYNSYAPTKTGGGASGTWGISVSGNASTASTLQTARTINGTSFNGSANITTSTWGTARTITIGSAGKSVNGSANISWSLAEIGAAAASHSHSYLPLSGGTLTGRLTANGKISVPTTGSSWISGKTLTNAAIAVSTVQTTVSYHPILAVQTSSSHVVNLGGLGDNVGFYGYKSTRTDNGTDWSFTFNAGTGAVSSSGTITAPTFAGALSGNATTATTLQTARTINGTSFNGSANITTSIWGTARTLTIGNTGKSVNGSGNVSWSLAEIGAAAASHSHSYLPLSGGTVTGAITLNNNIGCKGKDTTGNARNLIVINTKNQVVVGDTANQTLIFGSATPKYCPSSSVGYDIYHTGNKPTPADISAVAFDYTGEHLNYTHPRIFVPGKEWLRAPSGGLVPYKHQSGYLGLADKAWYDFHTVHINSRPIGGFNGRWWNIMPAVTEDGVMEIGRVIDFHDANSHVGDFTYRLHADGGTLYHSGSLGQMSDRSLKENIIYIDESPMLLSREENVSTPFKDFIKDFKFAIFNYKEDANKNINFGFIAQDIENSDIGKLMLREYEKENVDKETSTVKSIDNVLAFDISSYITIVAKALQEEIKTKDLIIEELKNKIKIIEEKLGL